MRKSLSFVALVGISFLTSTMPAEALIYTFVRLMLVAVRMAPLPGRRFLILTMMNDFVFHAVVACQLIRDIYVNFSPPDFRSCSVCAAS